MQRSIYVRPLGIYPSQIGEDPQEVWGGLPLAGGPLAFSALEVLETEPARDDAPDNRSRRVVRARLGA